jgi:hypothetical protein
MIPCVNQACCLVLYMSRCDHGLLLDHLLIAAPYDEC